MLGYFFTIFQNLNRCCFSKTKIVAEFFQHSKRLYQFKNNCTSTVFLISQRVQETIRYRILEGFKDLLNIYNFLKQLVNSYHIKNLLLNPDTNLVLSN